MTNQIAPQNTAASFLKTSPLLALAFSIAVSADPTPSFAQGVSGSQIV